MDREEIVEALTALAAELDRRGVSGEMFVVGGAAIALAFDERRATREDPEAAPVLDLPGLRCLAASPRTLLALKVLAHRVGEDEDDVRLLADRLGLESAEQVLAVAELSLLLARSHRGRHPTPFMYIREPLELPFRE